jgi:DNA-binding CsgD family transcriptional regulator
MTLTPERSLDSLALTPLQQDIAILVMNGLTNREIAERLDLTPGLVGVHIGQTPSGPWLQIRAASLAG